jgi:serine phosphatase RsbU (regulator of sigma subunit)
MTVLGNFLAKRRQKLILPVTLVLLLIGLVNLFFVFVITPQSNDECLWEHKKVPGEKSAVIFDFVKFEGVAWEAGIRDGDILLEINGTASKSTIVFQDVLNRVAWGDSATYLVSRNGNTFETKVEVKKLFNFGAVATVLLAFGWLIVGFIVIKAKPDGTAQVLFYRVGAMLILYSMFSLFGLLPNYMSNPLYKSTILLIIVDYLYTLGGVFAPFLIVHFFWEFPKRTKMIQKKYTTKILYATPIILFVLSLLYKHIFVYPSSPNQFIFLYSYAFFISLLFYWGLITGLVSLFISYLRLKTPRERTPIFVILVSYTLGVLGIIYTSTLANVFADTVFNSPEHFMPIVLIAVVPVAFGYSIFRYSLMDVSDVVKNTIMYGTATVSVAAIYFLIIYLIGQQLSAVIGSEYQGITAGLIFIVFAIVFQSTKDRFQEVVTRKFYPEQFAYQKVLVKFSNDVATIVGIDNILDSAQATFVEALKLDKFAIALKVNDSNKFSLVRDKDFSNSDLTIYNSGNKIQKYLIQRNKLRQLPVIDHTNFDEVLPENANELLEEEIFTIIPLIIKSKVVGLLLFGLKYSGSKFAGKDLELLVASSNQLAASIENARLYNSEAEKIKIEVDLDNARKIQEKLLPGFIPQIKGLDIAGKMIPAMHVGGDYYDLIAISDTKLFVVIGDVSGKGMAASFYMTKLQTMMRLHCRGGESPKEILINVNRELYNSIERNWFITASVALFDTEKKSVTYCRAGHTPLMILNGDEKKVIQPQGIGLGLESGAVFNSSLEEIEIPINNNDMYVLFSDGVNETMNKSDELYGMERFEEVLLKTSQMRAASALTNVLNSLDKFRLEQAHNDDITLVMVKYSEEE